MDLSIKRPSPEGFFMEEISKKAISQASKAKSFVHSAFSCRFVETEREYGIQYDQELPGDA
jgi:hypothetical protein